MLLIAGQTTGPIGLKFVVDRGVNRLKIDICFKKKNFKFFFPRATQGPSASS